MANVTLTRVVLNEMENADYGVSVVFEDNNGKKVSIAFNGRYTRKPWGSASEELTYGVYDDCPLYDGDNYPHTDSNVVRNLRDALNKLDLG